MHFIEEAFDGTGPSPAEGPEDILMRLDAEADEEFSFNQDRPDYRRVGRSTYVSRRRDYWIDSGEF